MKRRDFLKTTGCAAASMAMQSCSTVSRVLSGNRYADSPNVLMIVADDLNYDALQYLGGQLEGLTPNIDKMASEGIRFTNMFNTHSRCAPARGTMLTGLYQDAYCHDNRPG